jgi:hypothetical protein
MVRAGAAASGPRRSQCRFSRTLHRPAKVGARLSREGGNPVTFVVHAGSERLWVPAFAGVTDPERVRPGWLGSYTTPIT